MLLCFIYFDGAEIKDTTTTTERAAWNSFAPVVRGFLGNHKVENYMELVAKLVKTCSRDCKMSFKVHTLDANLDQFMENMGAYSEKLGERFLQDILDFEHRYPEQYNKQIMGDYLWRLIHESDLRLLLEIQKNHAFLIDSFTVCYYYLSVS